MGKWFSNSWIFIFKNLEKLLGPMRDNKASLTQHHMDIAHSAQVMYEEAFFNLLNNLYDKYNLED